MASRPHGRWATRISNPTTPRPSACIMSTAHAVRIPPSRLAASRILLPQSPMSRASSNSPTTSNAQATIPSTRPAASCLTRRICPTANAFAARIAMDFPALSRRSPMPKSSVSAPRSSTRMSRSSPIRRFSNSSPTPRVNPSAKSSWTAVEKPKPSVPAL